MLGDTQLQTLYGLINKTTLLSCKMLHTTRIYASRIGKKYILNVYLCVFFVWFLITNVQCKMRIKNY